MIDSATINHIKKASIAEKIEIIELIVHTLKNEFKNELNVEEFHTRRFKVRKFSLGMDVDWDRDELYSDRNS